MKVVGGTRELRDQLTHYLEESQAQTILLMKRGKPYALIEGVKGRTVSEVVHKVHDKKSCWLTPTKKKKK